MPSALSFVALLPHLQSAIVVASNALALNDIADWAGQMALELLVGRESMCDNYLVAARISAAANLQWYPNLVNQLQQEQKKGRTPVHSSPTPARTGTPYASSRLSSPSRTATSTEHSRQGLESDKFRLTHYHDDTSTWLCPRNELSRRGW